MAARPSTPPLPADEARPLRADARRNRERILAAAWEAFAERGQDVQMDEVAQLAGVGVGTLYRHFPAKEDLVLELVRQSVAGSIEGAKQALTREDPWEALEWLVRDNAANMASNRGLRDAMTGIRFDDESPWNCEQARSHAGAVLDRARDAGALRADITVDDWQALMCGLCGAIASGADPERQVEFVLAGLRAR
jgi:AcrR family transcriptional regulator